MAVRVTEKKMLAVQGPSEEFVVIVTPEPTVTVKLRVLAEPTESVAVALNVNGVGTGTVGDCPLRVAPFGVSQDGRPANVQAIVPVPPAAMKVCW